MYIYFLIGTLDDLVVFLRGRDFLWCHTSTLTNTHLPRAKQDTFKRSGSCASSRRPDTVNSVHTMVSAVLHTQYMFVDRNDRAIFVVRLTTLSSLPRYQRCLRLLPAPLTYPPPTRTLAISEAQSLPLVSSVCVYADPEKGGSGRLCHFVSN